MLIVEAKKIRKSFRRPALLEVLKGVDLSVSAGETVAITGASGEGKSTLLQILGTLSAPCSGELHICGEKVTSRRSSYLRRHQIGFVFQSFHLLEDYSVLENVLMPAEIAKLNRRNFAMELLESVGLKERTHYSTKVLSGGEKQRVAIARALCNDPNLILADEPTGNLDHENSRAIQELLIHLAKKRGKALVVATHDLELAASCDRRVHLQSGLIV